MSNTSGFTSIRTLAIVLGTVAVGYVLTKSATSVAKAPSAPKAAGLDNAMQQAKRLLSELRDADWNPCEVDQALLRLPEQDTAQNVADRRPGQTSFAVPQHTSVYDEVALMSNTFVQKNLKIVKGVEGTMEITGYWIVGWKDGRVTAVDVADVRYVPNPEEENSWLYVFPGMDEYDSALTALPGTRKDQAVKNPVSDGK